jgi:hypothetical protein
MTLGCWAPGAVGVVVLAGEEDGYVFGAVQCFGGACC